VRKKNFIAPDWGILFDRSEHYRIGVVPKGGHVLTAGVDVQNDRLEIAIEDHGVKSSPGGQTKKVGLSTIELFMALRRIRKLGNHWRQF
jgi:hypothetical protein